MAAQEVGMIVIGAANIQIDCTRRLILAAGRENVVNHRPTRGCVGLAIAFGVYVGSRSYFTEKALRLFKSNASGGNFSLRS